MTFVKIHCHGDVTCSNSIYLSMQKKTYIHHENNDFYNLAYQKESTAGPQITLFQFNV